MNIGFIGLGKLGLPVALAIESKGHKIYGYDLNPEVERYVKDKRIPYVEEGTPELLAETKLQFLGSIGEVVLASEIVFVAIQTPHSKEFEGITRLPKERVDFKYSYLVEGVSEVADAAMAHKKNIILVVVSTVLPGTIEREIKPLLNEYTHLCYNPAFIAMGTTRKDFEDPEFVLLGCEDQETEGKMESFYRTIHLKPIFVTTIKSAELIKVVYNTFISTKIAFINTIMEICHKTGADVDAVSKALSLATERVISTKYLKGGMGDGGGCHPRDNIAMSYLAKKLNISYDFFESIMLAREKQTEWLAKLIKEQVDKTKLPLVICGVSFKKNSNLVTGSPVKLLESILDEMGIRFKEFDPVVYSEGFVPEGKCVYFIGMNHDLIQTFPWPEGSVVIDPWGTVKPQEGVTLISIGRNNGK